MKDDLTFAQFEMPEGSMVTIRPLRPIFPGHDPRLQQYKRKHPHRKTHLEVAKQHAATRQIAMLTDQLRKESEQQHFEYERLLKKKAEEEEENRRWWKEEGLDEYDDEETEKPVAATENKDDNDGMYYYRPDAETNPVVWVDVVNSASRNNNDQDAVDEDFHPTETVTWYFSRDKADELDKVVKPMSGHRLPSFHATKRLHSEPPITCSSASSTSQKESSQCTSSVNTFRYSAFEDITINTKPVVVNAAVDSYERALLDSDSDDDRDTPKKKKAKNGGSVTNSTVTKAAQMGKHGANSYAANNTTTTNKGVGKGSDSSGSGIGNGSGYYGSMNMSHVSDSPTGSTKDYRSSHYRPDDTSSYYVSRSDYAGKGS